MGAGAAAGEAGLRGVHGGLEAGRGPVLRREGGDQQLLRRPASLLRSNGADSRKVAGRRVKNTNRVGLLLYGGHK